MGLKSQISSALPWLRCVIRLPTLRALHLFKSGVFKISDVQCVEMLLRAVWSVRAVPRGAQAPPAPVPPRPPLAGRTGWQQGYCMLRLTGATVSLPPTLATYLLKYLAVPSWSLHRPTSPLPSLHLLATSVILHHFRHHYPRVPCRSPLLSVTARGRSVTAHQSPVTSYQSPVTSHQSPVTSHQSPLTSHQSPSPVTIDWRGLRVCSMLLEAPRLAL